ncbi:hypothetical protein ACHAXS_008234 [Conticribra weissflogii]
MAHNEKGENRLDLSPNSTALAAPLNDADVEDALNFGMDFDAVTSPNNGNGLAMGDLGHLGLEYAGSMGTRSPSLSGFSVNDEASLTSNTSKRSRADFEEDSSLSDGFEASNKKRASVGNMAPSSAPSSGNLGGVSFGRNEFNKEDGQSNAEGRTSDMGLALTPQQIRLDREREGRCPDCGLDTHKMVKGPDQRFVKEPLTIEGEVLNGRCLFCNPLAEGESVGGNSKSSGASGKSDGVGKKKGENKVTDGSTARAKDSNIFYDGNSLNESKGPFSDTSTGRRPGPSPPPRPSSRSRSMGSNSLKGMNRMGMMCMDNNGMMQNYTQHQECQQQQQQQWQMMGNATKYRPFSPQSDRGIRSMSNNLSHHSQSMGGPMTKSYNSNNFVPTIAHSRMALMKQRQLPRKHTAMQHAKMAFERAARGSARTHHGSGTPSFNQPDSRGTNSGMGSFKSDMAHFSTDGRMRNNISSGSSISGGDSNSVSNTNQDGDDASRCSQRSDGIGMLGKAMAMGMGMNCAENSPQRSQSRIMMSPQSRSPKYGSGPPDPPSSGGVRHPYTLQQQQSSSENDMSARQQLKDDRMLGGTTPAARFAHSKLASNIYHHHQFPLDKKTDQALMEKTLMYLESGGGDIADIIASMRRFPFSLPIQCIACEKLYVLCFDRDHAHAVGLVGGIRTIVDAMEHHPSDVALQRGCAGLIKHLSRASPYNLEMLDRMGAVSMLVSSMERYPQNAPLQESCCWALEGMARGSTAETKMRVAKSGAIHAAMKAVEVFPENESLLRAAFHCLRQLGYNPSSYGNSNPNQQQRFQQNQQQHQQQDSSPYNMSSSGTSRGGGMTGMAGNGSMGRGSMMQGSRGIQGNNMMQGSSGMQGNNMMQGSGGMQGSSMMQGSGGMQNNAVMQDNDSMLGNSMMQRNGSMPNSNIMGGLPVDGGMMLSPNNIMSNGGMMMSPNNNKPMSDSNIRRGSHKN